MDWPLLAALPDAERAQVLGSARRRTFGRDEVVCHAGDPADSVHFIVSGHVAVRVTLPSGDPALLNVLGPGDHFGELALLREDGCRTATVFALEGAETLVLPSHVFHRLREGNVDVERVLTRMLADRVDALSQRLLEVMYVGLDRRVARCLVGLARSYSSPEGRGPIPLNQQQVAHLAGGSRASVNQVLRRLVDEGVLRLSRGRIEVLDPTGLARRTGL